MATEEYAGTNSEDDPAEPQLIEQYDVAREHQHVWAREDAADWVKGLLIRSRGKELPGNFNPLLMGQLFREQSQPWHDLAQAHLDRIETLCSDFVHVAINHVVAEDVAKRLQDVKLDTALKTRYHNAREELVRLVEDKQRHPITYDPSYTANVKEARERKANARLQAMIKEATVHFEDDEGNVNPMCNPDILARAFRKEEQRDQELAIAEDALDSQLAFYKV